ncbi:MAG: hypothetical protein V8Q82_01325 [Christensenellales bacterium]
MQANPDALRDMQSTDLIDDLSIGRQEGVRFSFRDAQVRAWLRNVGSALELHIYQSCRALGVFDDVRTSVVVDWQGGDQPDAVTNEIDVMADLRRAPHLHQLQNLRCEDRGAQRAGHPA